MPPGYLLPALIDFLPEALRKEIEFHQEEERRTGATCFERGLPCIWYVLETKRCRHYDYRPDICREIPVGGRSCLFWRERRLHHFVKSPRQDVFYGEVEASPNGPAE